MNFYYCRYVDIKPQTESKRDYKFQYDVNKVSSKTTKTVNKSRKRKKNNNNALRSEQLESSLWFDVEKKIMQIAMSRLQSCVQKKSFLKTRHSSPVTL